MRFDRALKMGIRVISKRRLAASERFLKKERDGAGLFADEVAAEQPTAVERIERFDEGSRQYWQRIRDHRAKAWRAGRRILFEYPEAERLRILAAWESSGLPGESVFFLGFLKQWEQDRAERTRPIDDVERGFLSRLVEWTSALSFEPKERLFIHSMEKRGLVIRRANTMKAVGSKIILREILDPNAAGWRCSLRGLFVPLSKGMPWFRFVSRS